MEAIVVAVEIVPCRRPGDLYLCLDGRRPQPVHVRLDLTTGSLRCEPDHTQDPPRVPDLNIERLYPIALFADAPANELLCLIESIAQRLLADVSPRGARAELGPVALAADRDIARLCRRWSRPGPERRKRLLVVHGPHDWESEPAPCGLTDALAHVEAWTTDADLGELHDQELAWARTLHGTPHVIIPGLPDALRRRREELMRESSRKGKIPDRIPNKCSKQC
jgi:hypothetical protein